MKAVRQSAAADADAATAAAAATAAVAAKAAAAKAPRLAELERQLLWQGKETQAKVAQLRQQAAELERVQHVAAAEGAKRVAVEADFAEQTRAQEALAAVLEQTRAELGETRQALGEQRELAQKKKGWFS